MSAAGQKNLRIGVDVGGTNTDGVILDPTQSSSPGRGIIAWHKAPTTANPGDGINNAIMTMFASASIRPEDVASVVIGTTQFVNAVVERDPRRLSRVAILRLSGPFAKHVPPCVDWPDDLREVILGYHSRVKGGLEVDGQLISDIDEAEVKEQCATIRQLGINTIVVNGVFSPIDTVEKQEERVAEIIRAEIPGSYVVCAREVASLGFVERENAAILNASILPFAARTIQSFQKPVKALGLHCPVFITQNDGSILSGDVAAKFPIKTFSSGPTNSMRGAAFLVRGEVVEDVMVVDIGGTTTDAGLLLASGFPRQQAAYSELSGVRMNFPCPDIKSIGLGGGSLVRRGKIITIGPDSVGYAITTRGRLFGGTELTSTDCSVLADQSIEVGDRKLVEGALTAEELEEYLAVVKLKLESLIARMKTSPADLPVILVGGGAIIAPRELLGASRVFKPKWSEVANAVGAAIARVSATVDTVQSTESKSAREVLEDIKQEAMKKAAESGALPSSVKVAEVEELPLSYVAHKSRFIVKAAGDFDFTRTFTTPDHTLDVATSQIETQADTEIPSATPKADPTGGEIDLLSYKPSVKQGVWHINETDLSFISIGCYVLGTGGGGSPYSQMVLLREKLRAGAVVRVVSPSSLPDDALVGSGGGAGSPTVAIEKLSGDEMIESQRELYKMVGRPATHMITVEIGGANGLQSMILGASTDMDIPAVDGDWMGRAYPTKWQTTPVVFNERSPIWAPIAMSDGNGNVITMTRASSDAHVERIMRVALSEMGSQVGFADAPVSGAEVKRWVVENTISQSWRIGRAVMKARKTNNLDNVAETIIEECGGHEGAQVIWKGKIVRVERTLRTGHVYGECVIEGMGISQETEAGGEGENKKGTEFSGFIKIPFKNENIAAIKVPSGAESSLDDLGAKERQEDVLAIVPDLISVIDAQNGEALGTPEYRYGQLVIVLGIAASDRWTSTPRGIAIGGPEAFGFHHLTYTPLGKFTKPRSVIEEFNEG